MSRLKSGVLAREKWLAKSVSTEKWRAEKLTEKWTEKWDREKSDRLERRKSGRKSGQSGRKSGREEVAAREKWPGHRTDGRINAKSRRERLLMELFWLARGTGHMLTACLRDSTPL